MSTETISSSSVCSLILVRGWGLRGYKDPQRPWLAHRPDSQAEGGPGLLFPSGREAAWSGRLGECRSALWVFPGVCGSPPLFACGSRRLSSGSFPSAASPASSPWPPAPGSACSGHAASSPSPLSPPPLPPLLLLFACSQAFQEFHLVFVLLLLGSAELCDTFQLNFKGPFWTCL